MLGVESGLGFGLGLKAFEFRFWVKVMGLRFKVRLGFWCRV